MGRQHMIQGCMLFASARIAYSSSNLQNCKLQVNRTVIKFKNNFEWIFRALGLADKNFLTNTYKTAELRIYFCIEIRPEHNLVEGFEIYRNFNKLSKNISFKILTKEFEITTNLLQTINSKLTKLLYTLCESQTHS